MKFKVCRAITSVPGVKSFLFQSKAVDADMKIINKEKFNTAAANLRREAVEGFNMSQEIVYDERGRAIINSEAVTTIAQRKFSTGAYKTVKLGQVGKSDVSMLLRAMERIQELLPGTKIDVMDSKEIATKYGLKAGKAKGFLTPDNKIVININKYSLDTPFHEYAHLALRFLKETNPEEYADIIAKSLKHRTSKTMRIANPELSEEALGEEIFVTHIGLKAAQDLTKKESVGTAIKGFFKSMFNKIFGIKYDGEFSYDDSFKSIIKKYSSKMFSDGSIFNDMAPTQVSSIINSVFGSYSHKAMEDQLRRSGHIKRAAGKDIYLGVDKRPSKLYYNSTDSEEVAKQKYLMYMTNFVSLKFQVGEDSDFKDALDALETMNKTLHHTNDALNYEVSGDVRVWKRASSFSKQFVSEFDRIEAAEGQVKFAILREKEEDYEKIQTEDSDVASEIFKKEAIAYAVEEYKKIPQDELDKRRNDVLETYDFKREEGTFIHSIAEDFINLMNKLLEKRKEYIRLGKDPATAGIQVKDYTALITDENKKQYTVDDYNKAVTKNYTIRTVYKIKDLIPIEATRPRRIVENGKVIRKDTKGVSPIDNSTVRDSRTAYLKTLYSAMQEFEKTKGIKNVTYMAEVKVHGGDLIPYAGTIDLLAIDMDTGTAYVIDHKTKESTASNRRRWNARWDKYALGTAFEDTYNNAENNAGIQTSIYNLMLENMGFKVGSATVFYTEGEIIQSTKYSKNLQYSDIQVHIKPLDDFKLELVQAFKDIENIDLDNKFKENKNDIHDTYTNMFNNIDIDQFVISDVHIDKLYDEKTKVDREPSFDDILAGNSSREADGFMNGSRKVAYPAMIVGEAARKKYIKDTISFKQKLVELEKDFETVFNDPTVSFKNNLRKVNIANMLQGVTKETHELVRISRKGNFGENYTGIMMFKDKITGEHRVIQLMLSADEGIRISEGRTTVYGKYKSDSAAKRISYSRGQYYDSTKATMRTQKVAMVLAKMKMADPNFSVDYILTTPALHYLTMSNSDKTPVVHDVHTVMIIAKRLLGMAKNSGDLVGEVKTLYDNNLFDGDNYQANLPEKLLKVIEDFSSSYTLNHTMKEQLEAQVNDPTTHITPLVATLNSYLMHERQESDHLKRHILRTILHLKGFRASAITQDINFFEKYLSTPSNTSNLHIQMLSDHARLNRGRARDAFLDYTAKHEKELKKFLGRDKIKSRTPGILPEFKAMFRPMEPGKPENWYRFKPDSELSANQIAYKKYFKETFREAITATEERETSSMARLDQFLEDDYIPLVSTSFIDKVMQNEMDRDIGEEVKSKLTLTGSVKQDSEEGLYDMSNSFADGLGKDKRNWVDQDATKVPIYEMDLEAILDRVYAQSMAVKHGRDTLIASKGIALEIKYQAAVLGHDTQGLADITNLIGQVFIKGEIGLNKIEMLVGKVNTLATFLAIAGSPRSILLETITNALNLSKLWIREDIMSRVFNTKSKFKAKHMAKAMKLMYSDNKKADVIMLRFGMQETDPKRLRKFTSAIEKGKLFKTDIFFAPQAAALSIVQMEVLVSIMLADGSYDAYTESDGALIYNEKKDRRFFNADGSQTAEQKAIYKYTKEVISKEGRLNDDGTMQIGYTNTDVNEIKNYAVDAFSSMDLDAQGAASAGMFGKLIGKFRNFFNPRTGRFVAAPIEEGLRESSIVATLDDDGNVTGAKRIYAANEGYLHTIGTILNNLRHDGRDMEKLSERDKANLADAAADATTMLLVLLLLNLVTCDAETKKSGQCWHKSSAAGNLLYTALSDSPGDVLVPLLIWDTVAGNGSMFPSFAVAERAVRNIFATTSYLVGGDLEAAGEEAVKLTSLSKHMYNLGKESFGSGEDYI